MDAGISGAKESTSKPRRDKWAPQRRLRVLQALLMQGGILVILLGLAWLQRRDPQALALYLATLIVPLGWGYAFWSAHQREEAARRDGRWSKESDAREKKRTFGILGVVLVTWVVLAMGSVLLF